jgi:crossover junction endodeoxyribonuclease RuvC
LRVIGIDPGTLLTGYGVVEQQGSRIYHVASGVISPGAGELSFRLTAIFDTLDAMFRTHTPDAAAVEDLFHARNAKSALMLGHARGVALLAAGRANLPVHAYAPPLVKKAVTGHGRADKLQVTRMVRALLGLAEDPPEDAADALAVAICHCHRAVARERLETPAPDRGIRGLR